MSTGVLWTSALPALGVAFVIYHVASGLCKIGRLPPPSHWGSEHRFRRSEVGALWGEVAGLLPFAWALTHGLLAQARQGLPSILAIARQR